jgi:hypothetical protein
MVSLLFWFGCNLRDFFVCTPKPNREDLFKGKEEQSCKYWSLNTRNVTGLDLSGKVLKSIFSEYLRVMVKPNGVVSWSVKMRFEFGCVNVCSVEIMIFFESLFDFESVILTLNLTFVPKLQQYSSKFYIKLTTPPVFLHLKWNNILPIPSSLLHQQYNG